jgi:GDP-mannose transporter
MGGISEFQHADRKVRFSWTTTCCCFYYYPSVFACLLHIYGFVFNIIIITRRTQYIYINNNRLWAPVNILFCLMLFTGMASLQYNSVPMVTIFKNITNIVVTIGDYYCFGTTAGSLVILAFAVMLSGAVAAAWNDIEMSALGVFWMAMNCVSTAGYILYMKFATKNVKLSKFGMVFYNNVLCSVFLLPCAIVMGQVTIFLKTPAIHTTDYFLKNFFAGFVGFFLNFASLTCVAATGPTTYAIVGSLNKVPVAILGYILFDNVITTQTWFFIAISMSGGFLYSYAKIMEGRKKPSDVK